MHSLIYIYFFLTTGLRLDFDNSDNSLDAGLQRTVTVERGRSGTVGAGEASQGRSSPLDEESERSSGGEEEDEEEGGEGDSCSSTGRSHRVARIIGGLPIAEYAESPRRYGPPRPGFPQVLNCIYYTS